MLQGPSTDRGVLDRMRAELGLHGTFAGEVAITARMELPTSSNGGLSYLASHLEVVILPKDTILYEPGEPIRYTGNVHAAGGNLLTRRVLG